MHELLYVSTATKRLSERDILTLLERARKKNASLGITGILIYQDGQFLQVLEGIQTIVYQLFDQIAQDHRHHEVTLLHHSPIVERSFEGWHMAYGRLEDAQEPAASGKAELRRLLGREPVSAATARALIQRLSNSVAQTYSTI